MCDEIHLGCVKPSNQRASVSAHQAHRTVCHRRPLPCQPRRASHAMPATPCQPLVPASPHRPHHAALAVRRSVGVPHLQCQPPSSHYLLCQPRASHTVQATPYQPRRASHALPASPCQPRRAALAVLPSLCHPLSVFKHHHLCAA